MVYFFAISHLRGDWPLLALWFCYSTGRFRAGWECNHSKGRVDVINFHQLVLQLGEQLFRRDEPLALNLKSLIHMK